MDEYGIRELIGEVKRGHLSRRGFVQVLVGIDSDGQIHIVPVITTGDAKDHVESAGRG